MKAEDTAQFTALEYAVLLYIVTTPDASILINRNAFELFPTFTLCAYIGLIPTGRVPMVQVPAGNPQPSFGASKNTTRPTFLKIQGLLYAVNVTVCDTVSACSILVSNFLISNIYPPFSIQLHLSTNQGYI